MTTHIALCPDCKRRHNATNPPRPPTEAMIRCHAWIGEFLRTHEWPPTMTDIGRGLKISHYTAWNWCNVLEECGLLERTKGGHRRIIRVLPLPKEDNHV